MPRTRGPAAGAAAPVPAVGDQIVKAARRDDPDFDPVVLGITLTLYRAAAAFERAHVAELAPYGLNTSQFNVLTVLDRADDPMTMGELGLSVSVLPANLTVVVDSLVGRGFVERLPNPMDRRSSLVRITDGGMVFVREFLPRHWAHLQSLMDGLSATEKQEFHALLESFLASLQSAVPDGARETKVTSV